MPKLSKHKRMKYFAEEGSFDGDVEILSNGNGFVLDASTGEKFFIKRNNLKGAISGDRVKILTKYSKYGYFLRCRVGKIIKRKNKYYTAKVYKHKKQVFACIYPFQSKKIILKHLIMDVGVGDIVKIQIINWRENHRSAYAKINSLIAKSDDPDSDYLWISQRYGIDTFEEHSISKVDQNKLKNILKSNF